MKKLLFGLLLFAKPAHAIVFINNPPGSSTVLSSTTVGPLIGNTTFYIINGLSPGTTTQQFSVALASSAVTITSSMTVKDFGLNINQVATSTGIYIVPKSTDPTGYALVVRDPLNSTSRIEMKSFGRITVNQTQNNPIPDNNLSGSTTLLDLYQNGTIRFAVFATGTLYITNSLSFINGTPPIGITYGNSQIYFNDGAGNIQARTADAAATSILREGNTTVSGITEVFSLRENITGTPTAGYGLSLPVKLKSSTTSDQYASEVQTSWSTATDATRKARLTIGVHDFNTSALSPRIGFQMDTDGINPYETFFGSATFISSVTINGPLIQNGTGGTSGQVLTSNGVNAAATWQAASGGSATGADLNLFVSTGLFVLNNSATISTITMGGPGSLTLAANSLIVGKNIHGYIVGASSSNAAPNTLALDIKVGTVTVVSGGTSAGSLTSLINGKLEIEFNIICISTGTSGSVFTQANFIQHLSAAAGASTDYFNTAFLSPVTIDTTQSNTVNVTLKWTTAATSAGNIITHYILKSESVN